MSNQQMIFDTLLWACAILFAVWPILFLNLTARHDRLRSLLITWIIFDALRIITFFDTTLRKSILIPEPLNTSLFFVTGASLIVLYLAKLNRGKPHKPLTLQQVRKPNHLPRLTRADFIDMVTRLLNDVGHDAEMAEPNSLHVDISLRTIKGDLCLVRCITDENPISLDSIITTTSAFARIPKAKVMIATPDRFSDPAREWAEHNQVLLYEGQRIFALWDDYRHRQ